MNVLVTGATGLIGSALVVRLREAGHSVTGLSRNADAARRRVPALTQAWSWQPTSGPPPTPALEDADAVVNLAGESVSGLWTESKKRRIRKSRILTTHHLVEGIAAAERRPRVLVSSSAIGYYGDRGEEPLDENAGPGSGFLADVCRDWEREAGRAAEIGLRVVCVRTALVMTHLGGALPPLRRATRLGLGGPIGNGRQFWPWVHLDDIVGLFAFAVEDDRASGPLNGAAPEPVRQVDFQRTLSRVLSRPAFVKLPALALKPLGEFSLELLGSRRVVPERTIAIGFRHRHAELEPALTAIERAF